jgi:phage tail sheath protein FI
MAFFHGVKTSQVPTRLVPSAQISAAILMAFGCAPIHRVSDERKAKAMPGNINLCYSSAEAGEQLGMQPTDDFDKWDLSAAAYSQFNLYNYAPVLFVNIFDPATHSRNASNEAVAFIDGKATLANADIIGNVSLAHDGAALTESVDFHLNRIAGTITVVEGGALENASGTVTVSYRYAAPELATADDCIGGYNVATGISSGLELVDLAFPKFSLIPGILVAPRFSSNVTVAAIMAAKSQNINSVFNAVAFADIPASGDNAAKLYSDVPQYKNKNSLVSENLYLCWPRAKFGEREIPLSILAAGIAAAVDAANSDIPYASPSNKNLQMQSAIADGKEVWLDLPKANYLNASGIATALNFNGWRLWGNRTAAYPGNTDPKDSFISSRRMLAWYGNRLVLTYFQKVDDAINNRLIQTIVNSEQIFLNSLVSAGALTGGRIEFLQEENSITSVMDGMIRFHVFLGLAAPAENIEFILEYDPAYIQALFE